MRNVTTERTSHTFGEEAGMTQTGFLELKVVNGVETWLSRWKPEPEEILALMGGGLIVLSLQNGSVALSVEPS